MTKKQMVRAAEKIVGTKFAQVEFPIKPTPTARWFSDNGVRLTPAPCGCLLRLDSDGLIRLQQCSLHNAAPELLRQLKALAEQISSVDHWVVPPNVVKAIKEAEGK